MNIPGFLQKQKKNKLIPLSCLPNNLYMEKDFLNSILMIKLSQAAQ